MDPPRQMLKDFFTLHKESLDLFLDIPNHSLKGACRMKFSPSVPLESLAPLNCDLALRINAKQLNILSVGLPAGGRLGFSYPELAEQALSNGRLFAPVRDLNSINAIQRVWILWEGEARTQQQKKCIGDIWDGGGRNADNKFSFGAMEITFGNQ